MQQHEDPGEGRGHKATLFLVESRGRHDLRALFEIDPGICGLGMFIDIIDDPTRDEPVLSDGRAIFVGPSLTKLAEREQAYMIGHAVIHHALRHAKRMAQMKRQDATFVPWIWNLAADAVVNDALDRVPVMQRPRNMVDMAALIELIPDARLCSLEQLYRKIKDALPSDRVPKAWATMVHSDLVPDNGDASGDAAGESAQTLDDERWNERLKKAFGRYPAGLERILGQLPKVKTPWERVLRSHVARHVGTRSVTDPSRPHRRWLALEPEMREAGMTLPVMPGSLPRPKARIAVAIDTSGSVSKDLLARFIAEICGIMRQMHVGVRVITIDADVQQIEDFTDPAKLLGFMPKGGGGTAFAPALDAAADYEPTVLVYLTDLEGPAPPTPRFPVIWATPAGANVNIPFGTHLELF
jgi:predicted metal-dependent peptidase